MRGEPDAEKIHYNIRPRRRTLQVEPLNHSMYSSSCANIFDMSAAVKSNGTLVLPKWKRPEKTKNKLPWADIKTIDLQKFDLPGGKQELAEELRDAVRIHLIYPSSCY